MSASRWKFALLCAVLIGIHLNYWMWDDTSILLGLPSNLLYHVVWSFLLSGVMWGLVARRKDLEEDPKAGAGEEVLGARSPSGQAKS